MPSPSCSGENRGAAHRGEAAVGANLGWWEQRAQGPGTDTEMCQGLRTLHPMREEQGGGHSSSVQMVSASCSLQSGPVGRGAPWAKAVPRLGLRRVPEGRATLGGSSGAVWGHRSRGPCVSCRGLGFCAQGQGGHHHDLPEGTCVALP